MTAFSKNDVVPGMAYLPRTGPQGRTCGECEEFLGTKRQSGIGKGQLNDGRCQKFITMSRGGGRAVSFAFSPNTPCCKYFRPAIFEQQAKPKVAEAQE